MALQNATTAPSLGMTLGAVYIGATVAAILFGITNLQAVVYYKKYADDWAFDALHVALGTHALYHYLIDLFGDYIALDDTVCLAYSASNTVQCMSFSLSIEQNGALMSMTYSIYTVRIWRLGHHYHQMLPLFVLSIYTVFSMAVISDFVIAFSMCYYPHKSRDASAFSSTSKRLLGLIRLVVISGLATSTCSLITLITYLALPNSLIFLGIDFILPKCHSTLIPLLNYRKDHCVPTNGRHSVVRVLKFKPQNSGVDDEDVNISIPMQSFQSLNHRKEGLDFQL
ncbi:hypothetical protein ARMGADRAFT_1021548 [Armillaria gallica]|uniref:DUF6534 domain-containing protein n=1 Tax=Armillaria gallica TaxID=47427 RepID=A0A2H3CVQ9_ARMGA|nr:hypothetical protein ARMGADRAFT_1021548 [Armillaria gallica]